MTRKEAVEKLREEQENLYSNSDLYKAIDIVLAVIEDKDIPCRRCRNAMEMADCYVCMKDNWEREVPKDYACLDGIPDEE